MTIPPGIEAPVSAEKHYIPVLLEFPEQILITHTLARKAETNLNDPVESLGED
jgi:hypothetical protein